MDKDIIPLERIPRGISLRRIKKRAMLYAQTETQKKRLGKAAVIPLIAAICLTCLGVFAVTRNPWGLFFSNTELLEQDNAVIRIGETRDSGDYRVTLEEAAFSGNSVFLMFSLERIDGGILPQNISFEVDIPHYGDSVSGSQSSRLSEDGRKVFVCHQADLGRSLPDVLTVHINSMKRMPAEKIEADWPINNIYSEDYGAIIAGENLSGLDELYGQVSGLPIEGTYLDFFAAGRVDDRLAVVCKFRMPEKRYEFLSALYDPGSDTHHLPDVNDTVRLSEDSGTGYEIYYFDGIHEQDLAHLYPVVGCLTVEEPMPVNLSFDVDTRSAKLAEATYREGFQPIAETGDLAVESIRISPRGLVITAYSDAEIDINILFGSSDAYCLLEDGTRMKVAYISSSASGGSRIKYSIDFLVRDALLDARKVTAITINDQIFWQRP